MAIGMCRKTGRTLKGWDQFLSRLTQVLTTYVTARNKVRGFGCLVPTLLSKNASNATLSLLQHYVMAAFSNPENGIDDFTPSRVVAERTSNGATITIYGTWNDQAVSPFTVELPMAA